MITGCFVKENLSRMHKALDLIPQHHKHKITLIYKCYSSAKCGPIGNPSYLEVAEVIKL